MNTSRTLRSFAITLAIAITLVGPRANGFTIDRTKSTSTIATHLPSDEITPLRVKDNLKRSLDTTTIKNEETTRTASITKKDETIKYKVIPTTPEVKTEKTSITTRATTVPSTTEFLKIPTISSDTVEVFDSAEDTTFYNKSEIVTNDNRASINLNKPRGSTTVTSDKLTTTSMTIDKTQMPEKSSTTVDTTTIKMETPKTIARSAEATKLTTPMYVTTEKSKTSIEMAPATMSLTPSDVMTVLGADIPPITTISLDIVSTSTSFSTTQNDVKVPEASSDLNKTQSTTENSNTKVTDPSLDKYTKYTTIIRKRVSSSEETTATTKTEEDAMKAETSNTHINLEKAFNVTLIPSLQKIRDEFVSSSDQQRSDEMINQGTREKVTTEENGVPRSKGSVQTKRAGYLDNSEKITTPLPNTENTSKRDLETENETVTFGIADYNKVTEIESPDTIKVSRSESFSQLAEDAIQEELLKEEALSNHEENVNRYHEEIRTGIKPRRGDSRPATQSNAAATDDSLSVQPIERTKTTIYTISDNYKPMKKIDVQPAKPFVRDPDDNSWRNESISSLGIVFKPKTSSKSFKEVLKNKTQVELNNLIDRVKSDVPDLRVRLEKIAEVRKKKKMNKSGEVVYTDYEEGNSAENNNTSKIDFLTSILSSNEMSKLMTPSSPQTKPETTTTNSNTNNEEIVNKTKTITELLFSDLGLDHQLTTQKPRKLFNIAEYYDTTDEYDADYVTMSKIDLKKFTVSPRTTPLITKPKESYLPERKPTVQYFPPRDSQKVNIKNADKYVERKPKPFTYKEHTRIEPQPPYVTLPPLSIATAKPQSEMRPVLPMRPLMADLRPDPRPTPRPVDFTIYSPVDMNKNYYVTNQPRATEPQDPFVSDGHFDRGSYVIKHYKDFLNAAIKDNDDEHRPDFLPYHATEPPRDHTDTEKPAYKSVDEEDDYDAHFRKEVLTRFVDNFNQNSERFKVDFPILYNNSIVHRKGTGEPAASKTFLKRLYHDGMATRANGLLRKPCEPNCEMTVELSPAYELHYYVPGQEEREEPRTSPVPYRYGL